MDRLMPLRATAAIAAFAAFLACGDRSEEARTKLRAADGPPRYVGGEVCGSCHAAELERWRGSQHDLAMQLADETSVLGNFDAAAYTHFGVTTRFSRRDGKFIAHTDGPDGVLRDYEIAYTFGVYPLQQYLIAFPGGRLRNNFV